MDSWGRLAHLSTNQIKALQDKKLREFVSRYLYPFSPHYKKSFDQNKVHPRDIRGVEDLQRLAFTSKLDFLDPSPGSDRFRDFVLHPDETAIKRYWPLSKKLSLALGSIQGGPASVKQKLGREFRPVFMTFTTGTTNHPVPFLYSSYDIQNLHISGSRMLELFRIGESERILNIFPYAPHLAFWQVVFGALSSGVLALSTGGGKVMGTEGNIAAILKMKPSVILGVPSYIYHVVREAREKRVDFRFVKKIVLGAARITKAFKIKLAEDLASLGASDVSILGTYGFTEARAAWAECPGESLEVSTGYHLYPDKEIFEVIDPETGKVKGEGEDGELVYTALDARASVVFRYRTGDFVRGGITREPCPSCGRTTPRLSSDITRLSDIKDLHLSKIKGTLVNLSHFDAIFAEIVSVEEWQVEIRKRNDDQFDVDEMVVYACAKDGADKGRMEEEIRKKFQLSTEVTPNAIHVIPRPEIIKRLELETANKEKRIVDRRPKE